MVAKSRDTGAATEDSQPSTIGEALRNYTTTLAEDRLISRLAPDLQIDVSALFRDLPS